MLTLVRTILLSVLVLGGAQAHAQSGAAAWAAMKQPGAVVMIRHALAPGTSDPAGFTLGDCSTQRNLDDRGRAQARAIGDAFLANGITSARVLSSAWCRCLDTARLLDLGPVDTFAPLNSFFDNRVAGPEQTRRLRAFLAEREDDGLLVLVSHAVNVRALTGRSASSGEMVVFTVADDGQVDVAGEVLVRW